MTEPVRLGSRESERVSRVPSPRSAARRERIRFVLRSPNAPVHVPRRSLVCPRETQSSADAVVRPPTTRKAQPRRGSRPAPASGRYIPRREEDSHAFRANDTIFPTARAHLLIHHRPGYGEEVVGGGTTSAE